MSWRIVGGVSVSKEMGTRVPSSACAILSGMIEQKLTNNARLIGYAIGAVLAVVALVVRLVVR